MQRSSKKTSPSQHSLYVGEKKSSRSPQVHGQQEKKMNSPLPDTASDIEILSAESAQCGLHETQRGLQWLIPNGVRPDGTPIPLPMLRQRLGVLFWPLLRALSPYFLPVVKNLLAVLGERLGVLQKSLDVAQVERGRCCCCFWPITKLRLFFPRNYHLQNTWDHYDVIKLKHIRVTNNHVSIITCGVNYINRHPASGGFANNQ